MHARRQRCWIDFLFFFFSFVTRVGKLLWNVYIIYSSREGKKRRLISFVFLVFWTERKERCAVYSFLRSFCTFLTNVGLPAASVDSWQASRHLLQKLHELPRPMRNDKGFSGCRRKTYHKEKPKLTNIPSTQIE